MGTGQKSWLYFLQRLLIMYFRNKDEYIKYCNYENNIIK